ncbi:hypothetical protein AC141_33630 [Bacteroides fragilis]|nr:hypothetical protein AC141_33630 [Bacteroides fragilis]
MLLAIYFYCFVSIHFIKLLRKVYYSHERYTQYKHKIKHDKQNI